MSASLKNDESSASKISSKIKKVVPSGDEKCMVDGLDLNELIQKNNGQDVDLQFYFDGKLMPQNTCFYEIY